MDYAQLAAEIAQPRYAGMSDAEIVAVLNTPGEPTRRSVPASDLIGVAALNGAYAAISLGAESDNTSIKALCRTALVLLNLSNRDIDMDNPGVMQIMSNMLQSGVLTPEQVAAFDVLATVPGRSRAQEIGLDAVTVEDVIAARAWQTAQEAEQARQAAYAALRERLVNGYLAALAQLEARREAGETAPDWAEVLSWM